MNSHRMTRMNRHRMVELRAVVAELRVEVQALVGRLAVPEAVAEALRQAADSLRQKRS